jgi:hypothetical protein
MPRTPNLRIILEKISFPNGLVNTSASWFVKATCLVSIEPSCILSRIKWQFISIWLVLSWKTGLAAVLSQYNNAGFECNILKSVNNERSQNNSQHIPVMALSSAEERYGFLPLCSPGNQRRSQKYTITCSGSMRYWTTSPVRIWKSSQKQFILRREKQTLAWTAFQIMQHTLGGFHVWFAWCMHKSA